MAAASFAVAMVLGVAAVPSAQADDLKDRQRQVEKRIEGAHSDLQESSARLRAAAARLEMAQNKLASARAELAVARGKLGAAQERDVEMQAELASAEAELAEAEAELVQGQAEREKQRQAVAASVADIYSEGDPELIAFSSLIHAESTEDLTRRDGLRDVVIDQDARHYDELKAAEVLLQVREQEVGRVRDDVAAKRAAAADHLLLMQDLESAQVAAKDSVVAFVGEQAQAEDEAKQVRAADAASLRQAEQEQDKVEEMLRRRAAAALRRQRAAAAARARASARANAQANASANRAKAAPATGVLMYPVEGYVTSPFGYRTHPIYRYWGLHDGVDFGGGCGTPMRSAAAGRVVSSYWSDVYGNRLIIDNGAQSGVGLATIYNHATTYTVGVGARVEQGQVIGYEGSTGWSTGCHLHFTVMANGKAVDPMNWF